LREPSSYDRAWILTTGEKEAKEASRDLATNELFGSVTQLPQALTRPFLKIEKTTGFFSLRALLLLSIIISRDNHFLTTQSPVVIPDKQDKVWLHLDT
jgi:hypothetical protein